MPQMKIHILTIFPNIFKSFLSESIIARAQKKGILKFKIHNIRDFATDRHRTIDDRPYGGGPGMIFKIEPIYKCLKNIKRIKKSKIILLTPEGKTFNQKSAQQLSKLNQLILICGRYEGFDKRVEKLVDEKISIGNYVLSGGEVPAMVIVEAVTRLVPKVIGKEESLKEETFCKKGFVEYPQYTRPEIFKPNGKTVWKVPKILLSGDHKKIEEWRKKKSVHKL